MKIRITLTFLLAALFLTAGIFLHVRYQRELARRKACWQKLKDSIEAEAGLFKAKSGIVIKDLRFGWEIKHNADEVFASASLVKIPVMAAVFKAASEGEVSLQQQVVLTNGHKTSGSGVLKEKPAGTRLSVEELMRLMITESDNTAANIMIDLLGFDYCNDFFKKEGLGKTNLVRKMMDFASRKNGIENYTTASDMAAILEKMYFGKLINPSVSRKCLWFLKMQKIRDRIPARLPEETVVAHKTGLEYAICHDVGIVFAAKGDFLICVLTKGSRKARPAKRFISRIAQHAYNCYQ